jgi:hypothetical protein
MMQWKKMMRPVSVVTVSAMLLAGCGGTNQAETTAAATTSAAEVTTEAAETETTAAEPEGAAEATKTASISKLSTGEIKTTLDKIDNTKWLYNADDNVYYQLGISYCETPADAEQEVLAIFVPGEYMDATDNGDGTYTCTINTTATAGSSNYTAETAPIVFPVNTPGYAAQDPWTEYTSDVAEFTAEGIIYVQAGCRGRDAGAPAGVTDLKAAIRYIRYNSGNIAGNTDAIFSFGMSGGGAQSALLGVTGDSALYDDYLEAIGAVTGVSDAVLGSQAWCPITSLDSADEAYEWDMGNTRSGLSDEEQAISDDLTAAYADYINALGLTDADGTVLTLEESDDGRYQAGTYYEFIKETIEESLNNFLSDTTFPYDSESANEHSAGMGPDGGGHGGPDGGQGGFGGPDGTGKPDGAPDESASADNSMANAAANDNISRSANSSSGVSISGTYETAQDYIDALNANGTWVTYDAATNTATITSIADFAAAVKTASKSLGAFDQLDGGQGENTLFGYADGEGAHFDSILADILKTEGSEYADDYAEDLTKTDAEGNTVELRLNAYSPLYYLMPNSEGYETSNVAKYFRVNTGIFQSDTAVSTEANLVLALENYGANVEHSFVWGKQHTTAERTGDYITNFITWVNECMAEEG